MGGTIVIMLSDETIHDVLQFSQDRNWDRYHTPANLAKSICIESAELLECFQWSETTPQDDASLAHAKDELADVLTYCIMMADALGCSLGGIVESKLDRTKLKYPVNAVRNNFQEYQRRHVAGRSEDRPGNANR